MKKFRQNVWEIIDRYYIEAFYDEDYGYMNVPSYLNNGSSRVCFALDDEDYVVKVSKIGSLQKFSALGEHDRRWTNTGIQQSLLELDVFKTCPAGLKYLLNPIIEYGFYRGCIYIVQPKVDVADEMYDSDGDYRETYDLDDVFSILGISEEATYEYYDDIDNLCSIYSLQDGDIISATSNIGITRDNEIKIIDYGFVG